jgi:8-oxo-dGTP pyrophosphatase MutT (NUDIX family)
VNRANVVRLLEQYQQRHPDETGMTRRVLDLMHSRENCFERDCLPGHITASAWIVSRETRSVLLTHHRKLDRWLQLGGHTDGETDVLGAACREAEEESGLVGFRPLPIEASPLILDVDVHLIPARGAEPEHEHHDLRFLLEVSEAQPIQRQVAESKSVRWFPSEEIERLFDEESLLRMARKASDWLARRPAGPA